MSDLFIPADVPPHKHAQYHTNMSIITHHTQRLFLFACDQKMEHLNDDFINPTSPEIQDPAHVFKIASQAPIGALATHLGLISRYAPPQSTIPFIVKLNGKTNRNPDIQNPESTPLYTVDDVLALKKETSLCIAGIGLTIYIGSEYESEMLHFAAQSILHAHQEGLIAIAWIYARGSTIADEQDPDLAAGLAGLGTSLGADFVKIKPPRDTNTATSAQHLKNIVAAAGNTKIICSGGTLQKPADFLQTLYDQLHIGGTAGCATGRNIFQHSLVDALALAQSISALVYENASLKTALAKIKE